MNKNRYLDFTAFILGIAILINMIFNGKTPSLAEVFLLQLLFPIFAIVINKILNREKVLKNIIWSVLAVIASYFVIYKHGVFSRTAVSGSEKIFLFSLADTFFLGLSVALALKDKKIKQSFFIAETLVIIVFLSVTAALIEKYLFNNGLSPTQIIAGFALFLYVVRIYRLDKNTP